MKVPLIDQSTGSIDDNQGEDDPVEVSNARPTSSRDVFLHSGGFISPNVRRLRALQPHRQHGWKLLGDCADVVYEGFPEQIQIAIRLELTLLKSR